MIHFAFARWLQGPPLAGRSAILAAIVAVAVPTLVRWAVSGTVTGCEFTPYIPFVLLSAILLRWWQAGVVALASAAVMGGIIEGALQEQFLDTCFLASAGLFLASSAAMIGAAILVRALVVGILHRGIETADGGIVFSLDKDNVWASWYDSGPRLRLGSHDKVAAMMQDFLAQGEAARRLNGSVGGSDQVGGRSTPPVDIDRTS